MSGKGPILKVAESDASPNKILPAASSLQPNYQETECSFGFGELEPQFVSLSHPEALFVGPTRLQSDLELLPLFA